MAEDRKRVIIIGATSGLGRNLAEKFIADGWIVGAAGRNKAALDELYNLNSENVHTQEMDILSADAPIGLHELINKCGGMDIYLHCSGIALLNSGISVETEVRIAETNAVGFTRMLTSAFEHYEKTRAAGRIVAISSIAGVRGLESLPAYSASKAYDSTLLEALRQRAHLLHLPLRIVDIRPGWTRTPLLADSKHYFWEMDAKKVASLIYKATLKSKRSKTIGFRWKVLTSIEKFIPDYIWEHLHVPLWHEKHNK